MLSWPMIAFGWVTNMLQRGMASWKRMLEVLDTPPGHPRRRQAAARSRSRLAAGPTVPPGAIEFRHLTFAYGDTTVLRDVSARIQAGQTAAIVGVTGSGKSTLISLLARLHEPPAGHGVHRRRRRARLPLADAARRDRLRAAGAVPVLRHLADNVAFGLDAQRLAAGGDALQEGPGADAWRRERQIQVERAAAVARLDKDVADFPQRLRDDGGRARHHAVGRPEAAHRHRPRGGHRPAHPDPRRLAVGGGYLHRGGNPAAAARRDARAHRRSSSRTASRPSATPTRSSGARRTARIVERGTHDAAARARTASTPSCTRSSCSKRSWRRR